MRYTTHKPVATQIAQATGMPISVTNGTTPTMAHRNANQKVRICQVKWLSR